MLDFCVFLDTGVFQEEMVHSELDEQKTSVFEISTGNERGTKGKPYLTLHKETSAVCQKSCTLGRELKVTLLLFCLSGGHREGLCLHRLREPWILCVSVQRSVQKRRPVALGDLSEDS